MTEVSLPSFPQELANALGMPENLLAGQILASLILMALFTVPLMFMSRGRNPTLVLVTGVSSLVFSLVMGWLPVWVMAIIVLLVALGFGAKFKDMI